MKKETLAMKNINFFIKITISLSSYLKVPLLQRRKPKLRVVAPLTYASEYTISSLVFIPNINKIPYPFY